MYSRQLEQLVRTAAIDADFTFLFVLVAPAQDRRQNEPGQLDFYLLALSWSQSYCEAAERSPARAPNQQCSGRPFSFAVHVLCPQYEQRFPSSCQVPAPRLARASVGSMLNLMPSPRLIFHEWHRPTAPVPGCRRMLISKPCARRAR